MNSITMERNGIVVRNQQVGADDNQGPVVYGGIELDQHEKVVLKLHRKVRIFEKLQLKEMQTNVEKGLSKFMWFGKKTLNNQMNQNQRTFAYSFLLFQCTGPSENYPVTSRSSIYFTSFAGQFQSFSTMCTLPHSNCQCSFRDGVISTSVCLVTSDCNF